MIEPEASDPVGPLGDWLTAAGSELDIVRPPPATAAGRSRRRRGLIVLGGSMGATDDADYPYLSGIRRLLAEAVAREVPTLGICLGAQLLAVATGGQGRPQPGRARIRRGADRQAGQRGDRSAVRADADHAGRDPVARRRGVDLPPGAVQLASSPVCVNEAFRLGRLAWGIQFHIETTPALLRSWADEDAAVIADYDLEAILDAGGGGRRRRGRGVAAVG